MRRLTLDAQIRIVMDVPDSEKDRPIEDIIADTDYEIIPPGDCTLVNAEWRANDNVQVEHKSEQST